jgi:N-methylhydantoinase A
LPIDAAETFIHGSTVAINTAIERTGARTALLVTEGTRDVYSIGRGNRPEAYNLFFKRPAPYVPRQRTREIAERLSAAGDVVTVLARDQARDIATALNAEDIEAVAVCFLHSWANPEHEIAVANTANTSARRPRS